MGGKAANGQAVPRNRALTIVDRLIERAAPLLSRHLVCGSIRRLHPVVGDIDLVVIPKDPEDFGGFLVQLFGRQSNGKPKRTGLVEGVQVDILIATREGWGASCMHATGSKETNIRQRSIAKRRGLLLNERGLWAGNVMLAGSDEREVYRALGLSWVAPEDR